MNIADMMYQQWLNTFHRACDDAGRQSARLSRANRELEKSAEELAMEKLLLDKMRKFYRLRIRNGAQRDAAELTLKRLFDEKLAEAGLDAKTIAALKADAEKFMEEEFSERQYPFSVASDPRWRTDCGFTDKEIADMEIRIRNIRDKKINDTGKSI